MDPRFLAHVKRGSSWQIRVARNAPYHTAWDPEHELLFITSTYLVSPLLALSLTLLFHIFLPLSCVKTPNFLLRFNAILFVFLIAYSLVSYLFGTAPRITCASSPQFPPCALFDMSEEFGKTVPGVGRQNATTNSAAAFGPSSSSNPLDSHSRPSVQPDHIQASGPISQQAGAVGFGTGPQIQTQAEDVQVFCGPLLNYRRMNQSGGNSTWFGSVLIVVSPGAPQPELSFRCIGRVGAGTTSDTSGPYSVRAEKLFEDPEKGFWRFLIQLPIQPFEAKWEYTIPMFNFGSSKGATRTFIVQSQNQSMRMMFHSCNGFSVGTDIEAWNGPALWNEVNTLHQQVPFHVMIGGGDQIYNDGVRVDGPLKAWTDIGNPIKRRDFDFNESLRAECDEYYYKNYISWYTTEPFKTANASIPQLNIWDDHDIIDGFGSYTDGFMRCAVFRGIGGVAQKYYLLFQHHEAPPKSTFTTDAPQTTHTVDGTTAADTVQLKDTFVFKETNPDPSWIIGRTPGPYVEECSRSIYCQLGARIAFVGIDARTERTRKQINYPETYDLIFNRVDRELSANPDIKHLILLLGVPIAYPRLQWLENIFRSPIIGPIRFLNRRFGIAGGLFNHFDGQVDLLDDLDDHYTTHHHKQERKDLMLRLQDISKRHSVRISILGGDVHLCAIGRFYSNSKQNIRAEQDWRYMPNIISSAITNKPPPKAVADLLASRNKIHHLDSQTDETLLEIFNHDPGMAGNRKGHSDVKQKTANGNHATMPSRNFAIIAESHDFSTSNDGRTNDINNHAGDHLNGNTVPPQDSGALTKSTRTDGHHDKNPRHPIHSGEENAGTDHPAASGVTKTGLGGQYGLDVTLRVEINKSDNEGKTQGYGFSIPALNSKGYAEEGKSW